MEPIYIKITMLLNSLLWLLWHFLRITESCCAATSVSVANDLCQCLPSAAQSPARPFLFHHRYSWKRWQLPTQLLRGLPISISRLKSQPKWFMMHVSGHLASFPSHRVTKNNVSNNYPVVCHHSKMGSIFIPDRKLSDVCLTTYQ